MNYKMQLLKFKFTLGLSSLQTAMLHTTFKSP